MTGPEHFKQAEKLLEYAESEPIGTAQESYYLKVAQVHATLALTAAQALRGHEGLPSRDRKAWFEVTATPESVKAVA